MEVVLQEDTSVEDILDSQRRESEAREIIKDMDILHSVPIEKKGRWVWELIQNAKDCARKIGEDIREVNLVFFQSEHSLLIEHDGEPFDIRDLIALVRRTSNKSHNNAAGNTGKYGTGFVTTHLLSKKVKVSGYLKGHNGVKPFELWIDRTYDQIPELQTELKKVYEQIHAIRTQPDMKPDRIVTRFEYPLSEACRPYAQLGLQELEKNIQFTLYCNPEIKTITLVDAVEGITKVINRPVGPSVPGRLCYITTFAKDREEEKGLLIYEEGDKGTGMILGLDVHKKEDGLYISKLDGQARLFRDLPIIGTEQSHIPFLVQTRLFQPPEPRDGLRTRKDSEDVVDRMADANRDALIRYREMAIRSFELLKEEGVKDLYLLLESGLPSDPYNYLDAIWYAKNIQKPLRDYFLQQAVVHTGSGKWKRIDECRFIGQATGEFQEELYSLAVQLFPHQLPDKSSFQTWGNIIQQDKAAWPQGLELTMEQLLREWKFLNIKELPFEGEHTVIGWLNDLHRYLLRTRTLELADTCSIFPDQNGDFRRRFQLKVDTGLNEQFKKIAAQLGMNVYGSLLHPRIETREGIGDFDNKALFDLFNNMLGKLEPERLTQEQVLALFQLVSLFRNLNAPVRSEWFSLISELLPNLNLQKTLVQDMELFNWDAADWLSLRYTCYLVQHASTLDNFSGIYFKADAEAACRWLNRFYSLLFSNKFNYELLSRYALVLVQTGYFRSLVHEIYKENNPDDFNALIKNLHKDYSGKSNIWDHLIDNRVAGHNFKSLEVEALTQTVDALFRDPLSEEKVKENQPYNRLFHQLNDFLGTMSEERAKRWFPTFSTNRPVLLVKALGKDISRQVMWLHKVAKPIEELEALAQLTLPPAELKQLEQIALQMGGAQIMIETVAGLIQKQNRIAEWKKIGTAAQDLFRTAITGAIPSFTVDDPDYGLDFTLELPGNSQKFHVEIKSAGASKEYVMMSALQGQTASREKDCYALCVVTRDENEQVDMAGFLKHGRFVMNIGELVEEKLLNVEKGLINLAEQEVGDVNIALENKKYSVNVGRNVWQNSKSFNEFVSCLRIKYSLLGSGL